MYLKDILNNVLSYTSEEMAEKKRCFILQVIFLAIYLVIEFLLMRELIHVSHWDTRGVEESLERQAAINRFFLSSLLFCVFGFTGALGVPIFLTIGRISYTISKDGIYIKKDPRGPLSWVRKIDQKLTWEEIDSWAIDFPVGEAFPTKEGYKFLKTYPKVKNEVFLLPLYSRAYVILNDEEIDHRKFLEDVKGFLNWHKIPYGRPAGERLKRKILCYGLYTLACLGAITGITAIPISLFWVEFGHRPFPILPAVITTLIILSVSVIVWSIAITYQGEDIGEEEKAKENRKENFSKK
jgi:hypothetical protein